MAARAAAEKKEKEQRNDPDFEDDGEEDDEEDEDGDDVDHMDDEDVELVNEAKKKKRQQQGHQEFEDDLPPPPPHRRPKTMGAGASVSATIGSAQQAARGMMQPALHRNHIVRVEARAPTVAADDSFKWEQPRTAGGVRTGMQYLSLQMMIGTAAGTHPFPREKTQQALLAEWLQV